MNNVLLALLRLALPFGYGINLSDFVPASIEDGIESISYENSGKQYTLDEAQFPGAQGYLADEPYFEAVLSFVYDNNETITGFVISQESGNTSTNKKEAERVIGISMTDTVGDDPDFLWHGKQNAPLQCINKKGNVYRANLN
ncbi:MAG: hypothetical protein ACOX0L_06725 [Natronincolaceae bacterium]|jgi:hypothetical protein